MRKTIICLIFAITLHSATKAQLIVETGKLKVARGSHCSELLNNGKVLLFGGSNFDPNNYLNFNSAELYNPASGTWAYTGSMIKKRQSAISVLLSNGNVMVIGGNNFPQNQNSFASCEIYNVASATWSYTDSMLTKKDPSGAIILNNTKILVAGGSVTCELYDQATSTWSGTGSMNSQGSFSFTKLSDGRILATGGSTTAEIYDPATGTWTNVPNNMLGSRNGPATILLSNNKVLIAGSDGVNPESGEIYDPVTNSFTAMGDMVEQTAGSPLITLTNGNILTFGIGDFGNAYDMKLLQVYNPATNLWKSAGLLSYLDGIGGEDGYTIHRLQTGKILIVGGDLGPSDRSYLVNENFVGMEENHIESTFQVYPNPFKDNFAIETQAKENELLTIQLCDILGKVILTKQEIQGGSGNKKEIETTELPAGVYLLTVKSNSALNTIRVIKN
jgi:N-acetylneuraminic acid mutarotase